MTERTRTLGVAPSTPPRGTFSWIRKAGLAFGAVSLAVALQGMPFGTAQAYADEGADAAAIEAVALANEPAGTSAQQSGAPELGDANAKGAAQGATNDAAAAATQDGSGKDGTAAPATSVSTTPGTPSTSPDNNAPAGGTVAAGTPAEGGSGTSGTAGENTAPGASSASNSANGKTEGTSANAASGTNTDAKADAKPGAAANKSDKTDKGFTYVTVENGTYIIESEYGTVLDVAAGGSDDGTNVQGWEDNATGAQRFVIKAEGTDKNGRTQYSISAQDSGKALDVYAAGTANGTNIQIYQHNGTPAQRWYFASSTTADGKPSFVIISTVSGKVVDIAGSKTGANVRIWTANGKASQNWKLRLCPEPTFGTIESGAYIIESEYGTVLDVAAAGTSDGSNVQGWESNQTIAQRFYVSKKGVDANGNQLFSISSVLSGKSLDVYSGDNHDGTNVQIYQQNGTAAQRWRLVPSFTASGAPCFVIMSCLGSKALDAEGGENGSNVRIWNMNGSASQNWIFRLCPAVIADGAYVIESSANSNYVVDVAKQSGNDCANVQLGKENGKNSQAFALNYDSYTGYYLITNYGSGKLLDVANGETSNNANVWQYTSNRSAAQLWRVIVNSNGTLSFASAKSNKALTINGTAKSGANLKIYTLSNSASQRFKLSAATPKATEGSFNIQDGTNGGLVWDMPAGSTTEGTRAGLYEANGTIAQKYVFESDGAGAWYIRPVISGQYISVDSKGNITQRNKNSKFIQKWNIVPTNDGHFTFAAISNGMLIGSRDFNMGGSLYGAKKASHSGWNFVNTSLLSSGYYTIKLKENTDVAVEVYYNSSSAGGNISTWHAENHNSQKFYLSDDGNGYYTIYGGWSMLPWDVEGGSAQAGTNIQQYYDNGTSAQKWQITWQNGGFMFKSALGNFAMSLSSLGAGANVQLAAFDKTSANQHFLLNHATLGRASISDLIDVLDEYATGDGLKTFKSPKSLSGDTVDAIWDALYGFWDIGASVGFTLIDLTTGAGITYNSDTVYYSACSIKGPYSMALSQYVPSALDEWRGSFWHALDYSNNETYQAYFYNYGRWPLEEYNSIGHVENFSWNGWTASYTAEDLCRMWVVSQDYLLGGTDNAAWLRETLEQNSAGMTRMSVSKYGASPVYAKSGWTDNARTEGCLVMDGDHPYVCAIMSTTNINHSDLVMNLADALYRAHRDLVI